MTDVPFTEFAFKSTGSITNRTMPERLAEIINVRDFGALADGSTNDAPAIQAAIDWTGGANRGTIYFPLGAYHVTEPITYNYDGDLSIRFLGEGNGSFIFGNVNGYIFDRALGTPNNTPGGRIFERLSIANSHIGVNTGGIRMGSTIGGAVRNCNVSGFIGLTTEDEPGVSSKNISIEANKFSVSTTDPDDGLGKDGPHHIIIGGGGVIRATQLSTANISVRAYGDGLYIVGSRAENTETSLLFGLDSEDNPVGMRGFAVMSFTTEGAVTSYHLAGPCEGFLFSSCGSSGHDVGNSGADQQTATKYGFRIDADCATAGVFEACTCGNIHEEAGFYIEDATARQHLIFRECISQVIHGGDNWTMPTNAYTAKFINCNTTPVFTYAGLPTGGDVFEGEEFDISDSNTATWGATAAGSGANHVRVRYNGTNYTVVGK